MLSDAQLSREASLRYFRGVLPNFVHYVREAVWQEPFFPSPRCLYGATILAATIDRDTNCALRIFYLLANELDGWYPIPPGDDPHGGQLILVSSMRASCRPIPYVPAIDAGELAKWRATQASAAEYWAKWKHHNPPASWPTLAAPEPPKRRGIFSWLGGGR
jgi:hypothetical protein